MPACDACEKEGGTGVIELCVLSMPQSNLTSSAVPTDTATSARRARRAAGRLIVLCLAAVVGMFGLDALLFRTNLYRPWLEPDSTTGLFESILWREQQAQLKNGDDMVVTLGDSRFAYLPRQANELTAQSGLVFRSAGVAGSDPRSWYYMLRDLDPGINRYRAIVFGVSDYDDEDGTIETTEDPRSLRYSLFRLRLSDVIEFASSFRERANRWEAFRGGLLKGFVLRQDLQAFLANPKRRIAYVISVRNGFEDWTYRYIAESQSMAGLKIDWAKWKVTYPPGVDQDQKDTVRAVEMRRPAPQTGVKAQFRRQWFGKILDRYRGSRTKMIFIRLPRGPIPRPDNLVVKKSASIREFASRPNVYLVPEHAFDALEQPELFKDGMHLNRDGAAHFAVMLVREVSKILDPPGKIQP